MLRINLEVTETPTRLKQVAEVVVVSRGEPGQEEKVPYAVYINGEYRFMVSHDRPDGALALAAEALAAAGMGV
jgi:hypothetical protein